MSGLTEVLANKFPGKIAPSDDAIREIAVHLRLIGDPEYTFKDPHATGTSGAYGGTHRFTDRGVEAMTAPVLTYIERRRVYDQDGLGSSKERALGDVREDFAPIGKGEEQSLSYKVERGVRVPRPWQSIRLPEENGTVAIYLRGVTPTANKILVIKAIRGITGLGLKEAKDRMEAAPCLIRSGLQEKDAKVYSHLLMEAGAAIELQVTEEADQAARPPHVLQLANGV
jgi:ribosomal protein L7/L12